MRPASDTLIPVKLTVIVPAFNEESYLAATLDSIEAAAAHLSARSDTEIETIVVDNNSEDGTAAIARAKGPRSSTSRCRASRGPATRGRAMPRATCWSSLMRT